MSAMLSVLGDRGGRSKSPSGRERSRSRSNVRDEKSDTRRESDRRRSSKKVSESESDSGSDSEDNRRRRRSSRRADDPSDDRHRSSGKKSSRQKSDSDSGSDRRSGRRDRPGSQYGAVRPNIVTASPSSMAAPKAPSSRTAAPTQPTYGQVNAYSYAPTPGQAPQPPGAFPEYPHGAQSQTRHASYVGSDPRYTQSQTVQTSRTEPEHRKRAASNVGQQYAQVGQWQYAQVDPRVTYKDPNSAVNQYDSRFKPQIVQVDPRRSDPKVVEKRYSEDKYASRESERSKRYSEDLYKARGEPDRRERRSDDKLVAEDERTAGRRLSRLSIGGAAGAATLGVAAASAHAASNGHGKPPASPLLEAYTGTYQTISPMPSALVLASHKNDSDISDVDLDSDSSDSDGSAGQRRKTIKRLEKEKQWIQKKQEKEDRDHVEYERRRPSKQVYETRSPDDEGSSNFTSPRNSRKRVTWYDAEGDAKELAVALKGTSSTTKPPNIKPLIRILPHLSIDDLDALKAEYKKHATIGGQGINMSKHIKVRVPGHLGKAAYACSLGQWESEAYWANCFYQSGASRRELLIESLMGRTNQQIREIKNFFKDKKYDDDLEKCLKAELKADKFRTAILLVLEERRQAESAMLDLRTCKNDVDDLYEALNSSGGESAMIRIIVVRSDNHLREVLRQYERKYEENFTREMINKSRNLVGETLAHILNGALNRSMRDALLLHQAIAETAPGKERAELLMSRLIRLHWEPKHFEKVKQQYIQRYGIKVDDAIRREIQSHMKTEEGIAWTNFCIELIKSSEQ